MIKYLNYKGMVAMNRGKEMVKERSKKLFGKKKDGAKGIIEENGLLIVGLVLLFVFKDAIIPVIESLTAYAGDKIKALFAGI